MDNKIVIHNLSDECLSIIINICEILSRKYDTSANEATLHTYNIYIDIDYANLVPFMIRFFHRVDNTDYERIEII